jgi:L-lysine 2,3-aminomutase
MAQTNQQESAWTVDSSPSLQSVTLANLRKITQIENFSEEQIFEMEVVGNVLPFKANNYVIEQLIDWDNVPGDSMFNLTFPQKHMLKTEHYDMMASVLKNDPDRKQIQEMANKIRLELNPHPAGQMELNVPMLKDGTKLCV